MWVRYTPVLAHLLQVAFGRSLNEDFVSGLGCTACQDDIFQGIVQKIFQSDRVI